MQKRGSPIPSGYGGFILTFEPKRTTVIEQILGEYGDASESFSAEDCRFERCELVFVARRQPQLAIFALALMRRMGGTGGTRRIKMRLNEPLMFQAPIHASEAPNQEGLIKHVSTAESLRRIEPRVWNSLLVLIKALRPKDAEKIDRLIALRIAERRLLGDEDHIQTLVQERDAVGLALDMGMVDRKAVFRTTDLSQLSNARTTLDLFDAQPVAERSLIEHDARIFGVNLLTGFASARFRGRGQREVRTYVTDGTPIETATGVDLLVYQQQFDSFLMLQYKGMKKDDVVEGWSYSVEHTNLDHQLAQMNRFRAACAVPTTWRELRDQRLSDEPFYVKFCERTRPNARDESLVPGITMSAPHLEHFLTLAEATSQGHGRRVGYENCPRYLSNSEFIALARAGWIGCRSALSAFMASVLEARERGRAAVFAVINGKEKLRSAERARGR